MFKGLEYYEKISEDLKKTIRVYEDAVSGFENAILNGPLSRGIALNDEEKDIVRRFQEFCESEGIDYDTTGAKYHEMHKAAKERINFLQTKKKRNDDILELYQEIELLEKHEIVISDKDRKRIKQEAARKYPEGSEDYKKEVDKKIEEYKNDRKREIAREVAREYPSGSEEYKKELRKRVAEELKNAKKRIEVIKDNELPTAKKRDKKFSSNNGVMKIVAAALGPIGNPVYNAWATVHNANTKLRNKHPVINFVLKSGMVVGAMALASAVALGPVLTVAAAAGIIIGGYNTIKHTFFTKTKPALVSKKNTTSNSWLNGIKDASFKFSKSRGRGKNLTESIYKDIDMEKYGALPGGAPVEEADASKGTDASKGSAGKAAPKKPASGPATDADATKGDDSKGADGTPGGTDGAPSGADADDASKGDDSKGADGASDGTDGAPSGADADDASKGDDSKGADGAPSGADDATKDDEQKNSGRSINNLTDALGVLREFTEKGGLTTVDDWFTLENVRMFLGREISKTGNEHYIQLRNMLDEYAKGMPAELRERVNIAKSYRDLEVGEGENAIEVAQSKKAERVRKEEFERVIYLIENAPDDQNIMRDVNFLLSRYNLTHAQQSYIRELVERREERINEASRKGGK